MKYSVILFTLFFLMLFPLMGEPHLIRRIGLEEGISHASVYCMEQDERGFIWAGTFSGLNRYDGYSMSIFKPEMNNYFSLGGSVIFDLLIVNNEFWVATDGGGISLYDESTGQFTTYRHDKMSDKSIPTDKIFTIEKAGNHSLWVGTAGMGLGQWDYISQEFSQVQLPDDENFREEPTVIRCLLKDEKSRLWIGTQNKGLFMMNETGFVSPVELNPGDSRITVRALYKDQYDKIWVGTDRKGLFSIQDTVITEIPGFRPYVVRALCVDDQSTIWIGTEDNGLFLHEFRRNEAFPFSPEIDRVRSLYKDDAGFIWVGTRENGIYLFNPQGDNFPKLHFTEKGESLELREIRQLLETEDNHLWVGTDGGGLYHFNENTELISRYPGKDLGSANIYALAEDHDRIWIGTDGGGLASLDRTDGSIKSYVLSSVENRSPGSSVVWALLVSADGSVWAGTEGGGLYLLNSEEDRFDLYASALDTGNQQLAGMSVRCMLEDHSGYLWVGTWDGGLSRIDNERHIISNYQPVPGSSNSLNEYSINSLLEDLEKRLWVGTAGGGLNLMDRETEQFKSYTRKQGLAGDIIFGILEDEAGKLWLSTEGGLCRMDPQAESFSNYTKADGLLENNFSRNAYLKNGKKNLLFGSASGIITINTGKVAWNIYYPSLAFTDIHLYGTKIQASGYTPADPLEIHSASNYLNLTFSSLDYASPEKNLYGYRLLNHAGDKTEWQSLGNNHSLTFASLPYGRHILEIKGSNHNGIWSPYTITLPVRVLPPFYLSPWFFAVIFILVLSAVYFIHYLRTLQLHLRNRMLKDFSLYMQDMKEQDRKDIARDIHDELGQRLTALKMDVYHLRLLESSNRVVDRDARYESMMELLDESINWSKNITSQLRPLVLDNLNLSEGVEWYVGEFEKHNDIPCELDLPRINPPLGKENAIALFRIAQEMLTNVSKHAKARSIYLNLETTDDSVILSCTDDGCGINLNRQQGMKSFGLIGMKERTEKMGGKFSITGKKDTGTTVSVCIPLKGNVDDGRETIC